MNLWHFKKYADLPAVLTEEGKEYRYSEIDMLRQELASRIPLYCCWQIMI